jgi:nucleoside-diphosphate-sugar epimerase
MRILVAGGAGFIGSHLCDRLLEDAHEVLCLDNYVTGRPENVRHLLSSPRFQMYEADLVDGVPGIGTVDRIYHLASPASPPGYKEHPIETMRVNSEGTRHLLELAERCGARFLLASTSEVYGDPLEHPQRETYLGNVSSIGPRSMYDEAKRYAEAITMTYHKDRGVDVRIARIFNTYGPRSDPNDGRLVPNFVVQALSGQPITVYGQGRQTRSLCYVSDLVSGLVRLMESDRTSGEVVNLGNPREQTILEYAELIRQLTGSSSPLVFTDFAVGDDPRRRQPDITKASALLDWAPSVDLLDGLRFTIAYFQEELSATEVRM